MITNLVANKFRAVPYLETSQLMQGHPKGLHFSLKQPNVIVGPNGAGKSALLKAMALLTLSHVTGESAFDDKYTLDRDADTYWTELPRWREFEFLQGLTVKSDHGPALYYRPGHIPGNETGITHAMMTGYFKEAKEYASLVEHKSSGQKSQALLQKVEAALTGKTTSWEYQYVNWRSGKELRDPGHNRSPMPWDLRAEILKKRHAETPETAIPLVLMDEPEQSLDARAEVALWQTIASAPCKKVQVIVATHSLYPLLHPNGFNLIEAVPGYAKEVRSMLGLST
jgi:energy-coupling factor transporter ATP-binding protein EcfA2